ncbi:MAG: hypothetical protein HY706_04670 [Candidatus Hydrogenedentes bacterium]|nr:hypothetical protein [Candidatus Hydrogenedentota bacterium]
MKIVRRALFIMGAMVVTFSTAYGIPPETYSDLGNPEEPALRPYKWLWRGIKAAVFQPLNSLREGNLKTPIVGSVEVSRGVRRGAVEVKESVCRGLTFSAVRPYREFGTMNTFIEDDIFLRHATDYLTTVYLLNVLEGDHILPPGDTRNDFQWGVAVSGVQKGVDLYPADPQWQEREATAQQVREVRAQQTRQKIAQEDPVKRAQKRYIGKRAETNAKAERGRGNLLKMDE